MTDYIEVITTNNEENESEIVEFNAECFFSGGVFEYNGEEWLIALDSDESEELVTEYIEESIAYFVTDFILSHIDEDEWIVDT